jgi:hypothetical protein
LSYDPWKEHWPVIEAEWKGGEISNAEIGRRHGITAESVRRTALKRGWTRDPDCPADRQKPKRGSSGLPAPAVEPDKLYSRYLALAAPAHLPVNAFDTPERRARVLACIRQGMSPEAACYYARLHEDDLRAIAAGDDVFQGHMIDAEREWHESQLGKLNGSGDPRWGAWLLERNQATKGDYKPPAGQGGGNITIHFNMPQVGGPVTIEGESVRVWDDKPISIER